MLVIFSAALISYYMFPYALALLEAGVSGFREILKHPFILLYVCVGGYAVILAMAYCVDSTANARIAAGDRDAIAKRKEILIKDWKYTPEMAEEAIRRVQVASNDCPSGRLA
jgi:hypothetical protein